MDQTEFKLGALDLCRIYDVSKSTEPIWDTIDLVQRLESYGYTRYWLAEHHTHDVAHSSPEILTPVLAGLTSRMVIGPAGILLRFHSPLKVAKDFRLLQTLYPGRIDLGLARGGVQGVIERELRQSSKPDEMSYKDRVQALLGFLRGTADIPVNPSRVAPPNIWILGMKHESVMLAGENGTAFSLALFLDTASNGNSSDIIDQYVQSFQPSRELSHPRWSIAVAGVCAPTEDKALHISAEAAKGVVPTVIGTPSQCRQAFDHLRQLYRTNEFIFLDICHTVSDRLMSYRLLAEALELTPFI